MPLRWVFLRDLRYFSLNNTQLRRMLSHALASFRTGYPPRAFLEGAPALSWQILRRLGTRRFVASAAAGRDSWTCPDFSC